MTSISTRFWDEDEEEAPWQALLGYEQPPARAAEPPPAPMPEREPPPAPTPTPEFEPGSDGEAWQALAEPDAPRAAAPKPSKKSGGGGSDWDVIIAGLLDVALNKGRNLPTIVQQKMAMDDRARQRTREDELHGQRMAEYEAGRGRRARGMTPEQLELRKKYAEVAALRAQVSRDREDRLSGKLNPAAALALGKAGDEPPEPGIDDDGQSDEAELIADARGALQNMEPPPKPGSSATSSAAAGERPMTEFQRRSLELRERSLNERANKVPKGEAGEQPQLTPKQTADISGKVWKDTEYLRTGASFLQTAEKVLEKYAPGEDIPGAGTIDSLTPARFLGEDALAIRQAQQWMNNALQRADSGAAAPIAEELKFAIRAGANKGASEAEFRAGLAAARQHLKGELSSAAAGRESIARDVYRRQGIEDWVFGKPAQAAPGATGAEAFNPPPPTEDALDVSPAARKTVANPPPIASNPAVQSQTSGGALVWMVNPATGRMGQIPADKVEEAERKYRLRRLQ